MIIDVHTHTPRFREKVPEGQPEREAAAPIRPDKPVLERETWSDYTRDMGPVRKALVFNMAGDPGALGLGGITQLAREVNDDTAALVHAHPDRLIGFLSVHPRDPKCLEEIERATQDLGLRGIKMGPNYQNFDPLGEDAFGVFRRAQELHLPIVFHQGTNPFRFADLDFAHPRHMDRVAIAFPELKIVMAHMGHPWQIDAIVVARKHPNVYIDVSGLFYRPWSHYNSMRLATEWSVLHKLLFATDYPVATAEEAMAGMRSVNAVVEGTKLPRVPEDAIEEIINRDSLKLLDLADVTAPSA